MLKVNDKVQVRVSGKLTIVEVTRVRQIARINGCGGFELEQQAEGRNLATGRKVALSADRIVASV